MEKGKAAIFVLVILIGIVGAVIIYSGISSPTMAASTSNGDTGRDGTAAAQAGDVQICHKVDTLSKVLISVSAKAVDAHLDHGDCVFNAISCTCLPAGQDPPPPQGGPKCEEAPPAGDGLPEAPFECEPKGQPMSGNCDAGPSGVQYDCKDNCMCEKCGDGQVQTEVGEECDPPNANCDDDCTLKEETDCNDGLDNDGDGNIDGKDFDCCDNGMIDGTDPNKEDCDPSADPDGCADGLHCEKQDECVCVPNEATPTPTPEPTSTPTPTPGTECGNSILEAPEACDPPGPGGSGNNCGEGQTCNEDCTACVNPTSTPTPTIGATQTPTGTPS